MQIKNAVVLVTGANRGIGQAFAHELLARGARKAYAGVRDPQAMTQPGVQALRLDVNKSEDVTRRIFEANFFGMLRTSKAFAPIFKANGDGAHFAGRPRSAAARPSYLPQMS